MNKNIYLRILFLIALANFSWAGDDDDDEDDESKEADDKLEKDEKKSLEKLFIGRFELKTDLTKSDFNDFLKAMDFSDLERDRIRKMSPVYISTEKRGDNEYETAFEAGQGLGKVTKKMVYQPDVEFTDTFPGFGDRTYKGKFTFEGKNKVKKTESFKNFECSHETTYKKNGFTVNMKCRDAVATQKYKRVKGNSKDNGGAGAFNFNIFG